MDLQDLSCKLPLNSLNKKDGKMTKPKELSAFLATLLEIIFQNSYPLNGASKINSFLMIY